MRRVRDAVAVLVLLAAFAQLAVPHVRAASATFSEPTARGELGEPLTFETTFTTSDEPVRVELLTRLPTVEANSVEEADVTVGGGSYTARVEVGADGGHITPNTTFLYRFRVTFPDGVELGPEGRFTYADNRFEWRTLEGSSVRLHWYEGDEGFGRRALEIGERAVTDASALLGVTLGDPVDFFIYGDDEDFREALGPGTRENVGGQAHQDIRTMFGIIEPTQITSQWVDVLVKHELTHLVFDAAVDNPYHSPPRWLNEGLAVYLSEDYATSGWKATVDVAVRDGSIVPLAGLGGLFPANSEGFRLAYGESISAIDYFIRTYGRDRLVALIRSYSQGVTDDDAFRAATGGDLAAFDAAWQRDIGAEVPAPFGPLPAPSGPMPPDWVTTSPEPTVLPSAPASGSAAPTPGNSAASPTAGAPTPGAASRDPSSSGRPGEPTAAPGAAGPTTSARGGGSGSLPIAVGFGLVAVLVVVAAVALRRMLRPHRRRRGDGALWVAPMGDPGTQGHDGGSTWGTRPGSSPPPPPPSGAPGHDMSPDASPRGSWPGGGDWTPAGEGGFGGGGATAGGGDFGGGASAGGGDGGGGGGGGD